MSLDKVLHKIQGQINELAPTLELFVDDTIQPSVIDCENLQKQLTLLQESIAVYKYNKLNKEISPSFNIHAKVSAQEKPASEISAKTEEKIIAPAPQIKDVVIEEKKTEPVVTKPVETKPIEVKPVDVKPLETKAPEPEKKETIKPKHALTIGLNDKFRFINSLFSQNASEYNIALEQLSNLHSWSDTELYLNSLKNLYDWQDEDDVVKHFYSLAKKRFS